MRFGKTLTRRLGYSFIHTLNRIATWVMELGVFEGFASRGGFNLPGWLAMASLGFIVGKVAALAAKCNGCGKADPRLFWINSDGSVYSEHHQP